MDVPPATGAAPRASSDPSATEPTITELARRLDGVEAGLGRLGGRIEALAVSLESSFETAVATEVNAAAADLRHMVSELGRILVRDLGKLPQMLAKHREAIVAELRGDHPGPPAGAAQPVPSGPPLTVADGAGHEQEPPDQAQVGDAPDAGGDDFLGDAADAATIVEDAPAAADGDRSWRRTRRRHRQD